MRPPTTPAPAQSQPIQDLEAEAGLLGCIMLAADECLPTVRESLHEPAAFYHVHHQLIFAAMADLSDRMQPIDQLTLTARLRELGKLEDAGGLVYLSELPDKTPSAANWSAYLAIVRGHYLNRRMASTLHAEFAAIGVTDEQPAERHARIAEQVTAIATVTDTSPIYQAKDLALKVIKQLEAAHEHRGHNGLARFAISTGLDFLDIRTTGLHPEELVILAGRPGDGKTALAATMMLHQALECGKRVGFLSVEMNAREIMLRMLCNAANAHFMHTRTGYSSDAEIKRLHVTMLKLLKAPIFICDEVHVSPMRMMMIAQRMKAQHQIDVFYVDHVNEIHNPRNNGEEAMDVMETITTARDIARRLKIPVVALQQLNREMAKGKARRPTKADLRGHGSCEQVAHGVWLLYRDTALEEAEAEKGWTGREGEPPDERVVERLMTIIVDKNRNGPEGDVMTKFRLEPMRFEDFSKYGSRPKSYHQSSHEEH